MKIWVDDVRPSPKGYKWCRSTNQTINNIIIHKNEIDLIDIDHDAGRYADEGGDYIKILDYLEEMKLSFPIHIHSMNPVGIQNMRAIIQRNGWKEI